MSQRVAVVALLACLLPTSSVHGETARPLVAVVAENAGTEVSDFLVPHGVLAMSDAVDVVALSTRPGAVKMLPALTIEADQTTADFDAAHPAGADVVIVPAVHDRANPALVEWLRGQAQRGATLVGICDGVWTVAATGALDGRRATGHWYSLDDLAAGYPRTTWIRDRRYVRDGTVVTTTGVTASIPATLALIERIAGPTRAAAVAVQLGVVDWSDAHDSGRFTLSWTDVGVIARNSLARWTHEDIGIPIAPGVDQIALALSADALSRTYRSQALALADAPLRTRQGITVIPDGGSAHAVDNLAPLPAPPAPSARALDEVLATIADRYGDATADFVALQIEYPERRLARAAR